MSNSVERLWPAVESSSVRPGHPMPVSVKAGRQIADLQAELDDAKQSLERASKRINRLVGERSQLATLLEKRDDQIDRLNRELGMRTSRPNAAQTKEAGRMGAVASVTGAFLSVVRRTEVFFTQWNGRRKEPTNGHQTAADGSLEPHLIAHRGGHAEHPIIGIVFFGLDRDEIERLLPMVEQDCSSKGMKPLCLIDVDAFELLRRRDLVFEYLPPEKERDRFDASLDWRLYLQRRLAIIRRKWNPARVIAFGPTAMKTLRLWSSSPFESQPLPAVFSETEKIQSVKASC